MIPDRFLSFFLSVLNQQVILIYIHHTLIIKARYGHFIYIAHLNTIYCVLYITVHTVTINNNKGNSGECAPFLFVI